MPLYEYSCAKCSKKFEELVFDDDEKVTCPFCGSEDTERLISACSHHTSGCCCSDGSSTINPGSSSCGCAGCSGGNCATCGH